MLIDTHTHLYLSEFSDGGVHAVRRALDVGIEHMVFPNVDLGTIGPMRGLHRSFPESTSMAMGLHPTEIGDGWRDDLVRIREEFETHCSDYVAVGEIGIDLYWDKTFSGPQMLAFEEQVGWAVEKGLPVIVHCRDGLAQTLEVLQAFPGATGVMHSFGGTDRDVDAVRRVVDFYFGINGIVTFKNSKLKDVLPVIGPDRILLETDSPYLAPVPHRGKRNESAYLVDTADCVARSLNLSVEETAALTAANARSLFSV